MIEVERKYLVKNNSYKMQVQRAGLIVQGYLGDNPLSETRIAIRDNHGWLFIKAKGTLSRFEWQSENKDIVFLSRGGYMQGTSYTFNMLMNTDNELYREWDIMKVFKRVYSNFDQNHRAPYSLKHLESALDLVCIWDREKDACQEEEIVNDNEFVSEQDEYSSKEVEFY